MGLAEKVAYIKGLMDGLGIDENSKEGKILAAMLDLLDDMADTIEDMQDGLELLSCQIDDIDEELDLMGDDDFDDDDYSDEFDGELYEVTCPSCKNIVYMDEDMLDEGAIPCPNCGETLEIDLEGVLDECDCGHDHNH